MSPSSPSTPPARHTAEALLRGAKPTINPLEVTLERLGSAIKMGLYEPGDQLPSERELAQMMGISRSTVREATHLMVEQGILVAKRGRSGGIFVSEHPLPESLMTLRLRLNKAGATLSEILDHRLVVEMGIAELATQRAEELQIKDLQDLVAAMQETYDSVEYRKLDIRFHLLIAKATQTNRLPAIATEIHSELTDLLQNAPHSKAQRIHSSQQHQALVWAIQERDSDRAREVMKEHVLATSSYLKGLL